MLTILLGTDWVANRNKIMNMIAADVTGQKERRFLIVPELISHDTERRLAAVAGDTASRYVEVLSFSRLTNRVSDYVGHPAVECLDNGGRVVAMAAAALQLHSKLKAYASLETRPEFLTALVEAVDEFKQCCITAADLMQASKQAEGALAQKLEELSLLLECYDALCKQGKRDPRDQMHWLLEELEACAFAKEHTFYIDGFPDFTQQHMDILEHLIRESDAVTISLNCDVPGSVKPGFENAGQTAVQLLRIAERNGIECRFVGIEPRQNEIAPLREQLLQGLINQNVPEDRLTVYRTDTVYQECVAAAEKVMNLVRSGARYRDIGIVCADMSGYRNVLEMTFSRCHIPIYLSGTEQIVGKPVITTVLAALKVVLNGFEQQDVNAYLRSLLSPVDLEDCDKIENYTLLWGITRNSWLSPWENHPDGLGFQATEYSDRKLNELNSLRDRVITPLLKLQTGIRNSRYLSGQIESLYCFLEDIQLRQRLERLAADMDAGGDNRNAQILNQLWEIICNAMEQMYDVLGETVWEPDVFYRLFKLLISQYDVGTIPSVLDSVTAGPANAMRCQQVKHLIVLGAQEGAFPAYAISTGVLTEKERHSLREIGIPLVKGGMKSLQNAWSEIYSVFCGAEESVTVSCSDGQPSFIFRRLVDIRGSECCVEHPLGAALVDPIETAAFLARYNAAKASRELNLQQEYNDALEKKQYAVGSIQEDNIKRLYGNTLELSASQIDRQGECRMSYFLKYGLRARERKTATVDPAEFGTYVHAVLENTAREIKTLGGFRNVDMEQALQIAQKYSTEYATERFSALTDPRSRYLFERNSRELSLIVQELWKEMHGSAFDVYGFEVGFGAGNAQPAIAVSGKQMQAVLRGYIDRVDIWNNGDNNYFRVVDYKTGRKSFDYCDIFNGIGLQMLLYLFAIEENCGNMLPAGVQYFPARVPLVSAEGAMTPEEAMMAREKLWKRNGLVLNDASVLQAMESENAPNRLPYSRKKDGSVSGDIADAAQFALLKAYVFATVGKMVDEIASGNITPNPYTRGGSHNACTFCPYDEICHLQSVEERRNYKTMSPEKFWESVGKEVANNG